MHLQIMRLSSYRARIYTHFYIYSEYMFSKPVSIQFSEQVDVIVILRFKKSSYIFSSIRTLDKSNKNAINTFYSIVTIKQGKI